MDSDIKWEFVDFDKIHKDLLKIHENSDDDEEEREPSWMKNDNNVTIKFKDDDSPRRMIGTPLGLFNVDNVLGPFKHCEYQLAYTKFDVTEEMAEMICEIPGVEVFMVLSRYKFIIGIARLFNFEDVKSVLEYLILGKQNNNIILKSIEQSDKTLHRNVCNERSKITERYDNWAIFVYPNGVIKSEGFDTVDDMNEKMVKFESLVKLTQGVLLTSNNK